MRTVFKILKWLPILLALSLAGLAVSVFLDSRPLVPKAHSLTPAERAWAKAWLHNVQPRGLKDGQRVTLSLSEAEANTLGNYLIGRLGEGRFMVRLEDKRARLAASLGLPWNPQSHFVNLALELAGGAPLPRIERARLAGLPLPSGLVQTLADRLMAALGDAELLQSVTLEPGRALLTYRWRPYALEQVGSGLVSAEERARMLRYQALLVGFAKDRPRGKPIALAEPLARLLQEAGSASAREGQTPASDPVAENRAALLALAAYVNARTVRNPDPADVQTRPIPFRQMQLRGRRDLAQHFMVSAALAAQGGNALSDLLGLLKEMQDSDGGSGFSFADLAADRAGTRFGQLATRNRQSARVLQVRAQAGLTQDDIMPSIDGLPEGIGKAAFARDYGDTRSPAYQAVAARIEQRIDRLSIHRTVGG